MSGKIKWKLALERYSWNACIGWSAKLEFYQRLAVEAVLYKLHASDHPSSLRESEERGEMISSEGVNHVGFKSLGCVEEGFFI